MFLPIGNNGFLISRNAPQYRPSFELNRRISALAEELGFDYAFSMAKWRGFGGATRFWDQTLDSPSLMGGLAVATRRIRLIATVTPLLMHPAVAAKVFATLDEISGGRIGLNVVTGVSLAEYEQMGLVPEEYDRDRYAYAEEWLRAVKRLWSEERVTFKGRYFQLADCASGPKPVQRPHPFVVCAGTSPEGFRFTARMADYSFFLGDTPARTRELCGAVKAIGRAQGRPVKTASLVTLILGETDAEARRARDHLRAGADVEAIRNLVATFRGRSRASDRRRARRLQESFCFTGEPVCGGPETAARAVAELVLEAELDSLLLVFPDYLRGLRAFHDGVLPVLRSHGIAPARAA